MRILGITVSENKQLWVGLTVFYGIGFKTAKKILKEAGVPETKKPADISTDEETIRFGNTRFPIFKEAPRVWQPKLIPMGEGSFYADLVFQDQNGRTFHPNSSHPTVVAGDKNDEQQY